jgi:LysR family transcriptional regulator, low CO2-responsive transcriptional regulator
VVHTLSKLLSPAAEAFRYHMLEKAEQDLAKSYGKFMALDAAPNAAR